jgi:hypothetical protein
MKAKFRREALLSILVSYLTNATDIIDFFSNIDEEKIFHNKPLTTAILGDYLFSNNIFLFNILCIKFK